MLAAKPVGFGSLIMRRCPFGRTRFSLLYIERSPKHARLKGISYMGRFWQGGPEPMTHGAIRSQAFQIKDVNGEKLTVKKWWIFGADFSRFTQSFSRFIRDINGEKNISLLMIFFTVSFSRFTPSRNSVLFTKTTGITKMTKMTDNSDSHKEGG